MKEEMSRLSINVVRWHRQKLLTRMSPAFSAAAAACLWLCGGRNESYLYKSRVYMYCDGGWISCHYLLRKFVCVLVSCWPLPLGIDKLLDSSNDEQSPSLLFTIHCRHATG